MSHHHAHTGFSAKHIVAKSLEYLGLLGETISFLLIIHENEERFYNKFYIAIFFFLGLSMLFHHYFNQTNLERIEEMHEEDVEELGFSVKWIKRSKFEDILRIVIFILFSVISGAITYIIIVGIESYSITESLNLSLFSKFYVSAYLALSFIMLLWHLGCMVSDKKVYLKPKKTKDQHITFPTRIFPNALITSFISDLLGFFVWVCFFVMIVLEKWWVTDWLWFFAAVYIFVILMRLANHVSLRLKMKPPVYIRHTIGIVIVVFAALNCVVYLYYRVTRPVHNDLHTKIVVNHEPLTIVMEEESKPMYYMTFDTTGGRKYVATGFGYELAAMLADSFHVPFRIITARFNELPSRIYSGEADMILAGETDEVKNCEETEPIVDTVGLCLIVRKKDSLRYATNYKELLNDKNIGVFKGGHVAIHWAKDHFPGAEIDDSQTEIDWLGNFDKKEWDAVIYEYLYAKDELLEVADPKLRNELCIAVKTLPGSVRQFRIIVPKGNAEFTETLNKYIEHIKHTTTYSDMMNNYIRKSIGH